MRALDGRRLPRILTFATGLGLLALTIFSLASPANTAVVHHSAPQVHREHWAQRHHRQRVNHFNTGATHSPKLLRQLAGGVWHDGKHDPPPALPWALQGVDVASYQHPGGQRINWPKAAKAGIQFAAVKATEGAYYRNPFALTDLAQARAAGLAVMAYAFAIPNGNGGASSPVAQADYLINYLASAGGPVPPIMLDIEYNPYGATCYGLSQAAMVRWIARWSGEVQAKTGEDPIIYGPGPWWQECTGGVATFGQLPLWVPDYTTASSPLITHGWNNWAFWQYSSAGTVRGINAPGNTDLDQLNPNVLPLLNPGAQASLAGSTTGLQIESADPAAGRGVSFAATGLPAGTAISASGQITGWPSTPGVYHPTVSATDGHGRSGSVEFTWTVGPALSTGATGAVRLALPGLCLTAAGDGSANGTKAKVGACTGSSDQNWTYVRDGSLRINSKCLTISAAADGAAAELEPCAGAPTQQWHLVYPRGVNPSLGWRWTTLINPWSGMCLAAPLQGTKNAAQLSLAPCNGYADEEWTLPPGPITSQIPGQCLDVSGDQVANNTKIDIWNCNGTNAQTWVAEPDGTVRVNGKCLDILHGATASGSLIDLYACNGTRAQQWTLVPVGAGITLRNPVSGLCLGTAGNATANGSQVVISPCTMGEPAMSWLAS
jgi:GH25 family lysozyme M1 (1,4-beta-N-acetylmuramidase)